MPTHLTSRIHSPHLPNHNRSQTLALYGTWRLARRQPGSDRLAAFTRVLHRAEHDELSPFLPTFRAEPRFPECGQKKSRCRYPVADRPGAVRQFLEAARTTPGLLQAPWLYLIERCKPCVFAAAPTSAWPAVTC